MTVLQQNAVSDPADLDYWSRHAVPVLTSLLRSTESYSPADEEAQLRLLAEHVLPNLGPRPSMAHTCSLLTTGGSPFQPSLNLSAGKPIVRYCWELLGPQGGSDSDPFAVDAAREILSYLSKALGFSTRWSDVFLSAFAPTVEEARDAQAKLPKWLASKTSGEVDFSGLKRLPFSFVAFDLKGPKISTKVYFNPRPKEIATKMPVNDMIWNILRSLKPALNLEAISSIARYVQNTLSTTALLFFFSLSFFFLLNVYQSRTMAYSIHHIDSLTNMEPLRRLSLWESTALMTLPSQTQESNSMSIPRATPSTRCATT